MPKYTFSCKKCNSSSQFYTSLRVTELPCTCGSVMDRQIPLVTKATVKETMDKFFNIARDPDMEKNLKDRNTDHFWTVMVPRLVREHTLEHSLENGWMYYDEQGILKIQNKPPGKR